MSDQLPEDHPCFNCDHRESNGDTHWCKYSDALRGAPRHITWHNINPDAPKDYADCPASTVRDDDDDDDGFVVDWGDDAH